MTSVGSADDVQVKQEDLGENETNDATETRNGIIFEKNTEAEDAAETPVSKTISVRESPRILKIEPVQSSASKELKASESSHGQSLKTSNTTTKIGAKSSTPIYKNGFINFLKELESDRKYAQHTAMERIREAAALWKALPDGTKRCYKDQSDTDLIGGLTSSLTSSPYLNFLGEFRQEPENANKPQAKIVAEGAKIWSSMTPKEKNLYKVPTHRAVPSAKSVPRRARSSVQSTESFMMFVRYFSDFVGNLTPTELIAKASQHWRSLSEWKKKQFTQMAYSKYFKK